MVVSLGCAEDNARTAQMGIWLPPKWHRLREHLQNAIDSKSIPVFIHTSNDSELLSEGIYHIMCREGNICVLCTNFTYRTHLKKASDVRGKDARIPDPLAMYSPMPAKGAATPSRCISDDSEDDWALQSMANEPAILFLIFTKDDVINSSAEMLRHQVNTNVRLLRALYPEIKLLVVMHGIRLYALHGCSSQGEAEFSQYGSQGPLIHSGALDDLICSLMVEHQVDTIEAEDDVELAKFMVNASASVELCFHRKSAMNFKVKPQGNRIQELPILTNTWITQLMQIPEVGKDAATAIALAYNTPAEIMESVAKAPEEFIQSLRNLPIGSKATRKLGIAVAKRVAALYSYNTKPDERVLDIKKTPTV